MTATEFITQSERDTERLGECLAAGVGSSDDGAVVVAIDGELGAGKTRLVRGLAAGLGADPSAVTSPSFVVATEHRAADGVTLVHVDVWRLRDPAELAGLDWDGMLRRPRTVVAVEWASRIAAALPDRRVAVTIAHDADGRAIRIEDNRGERAERVLATALAHYSGAASPPRTESKKSGPLCPTCGAAFAADASTYPFCSSRCRMADLNRWFSGGYRVSRPAQADEELSE